MSKPLPKLDHQRTLKQLRVLLDDCKSDALSTECAMVVAMITLVRFVKSFDEGPRDRWLSYYGNMRKDLRNLQHALDVEFDEGGNKAEAASSGAEAPSPVASGTLPNTFAASSERTTAESL